MVITADAQDILVIRLEMLDGHRDELVLVRDILPPVFNSPFIDRDIFAKHEPCGPIPLARNNKGIPSELTLAPGPLIRYLSAGPGPCMS